ncbi:MAG TPA: cupin domain-containing protein [candidate division Zixibacteria bacterium]|nr:cupin domain-containing protein [candidate division Zixibacteria bacterium]
MKIAHESSIDAEKSTTPGAERVKLQWLISADDGAPNFAMRRFVVAPGGHTPFHSHKSEHELFVLSGKGKALYDGGEKQISAGYFVFVQSGELHGFVNDGEDDLVFLCMVPKT